MRDDKRSWPDDQLLRAANDGDHQAFEIFCERSVQWLVRYCKRLCRGTVLGRDPDAPAEFAQEAIMKSLRYVRMCIAQGRPFPKVSVAWINAIARNAIIDQIRKRRLNQIADDDALSNVFDGSMTAEQLELKREQQEQVVKCLNLLGMREREILELTYLSELTITQAGRRLGLKREAAYKLHARAMSRLRDLFTLHGEPETASIPS